MKPPRERLVYDVCRLKSQGMSLRGIERTLRVARKTVRRILSEVEQRRKEGDSPLGQVKKPRAPRASKLDAYADFIRQTLERYPKLRAKRLHEELLIQGFDGGYTIVREYLQRVRPKAEKQPCLEVKTAPGQQAQADWSPYKIESGIEIHAFSCVLGYSRHLYMHFCEDEKQLTLFRQLRNAFEGWQGVPEEIVFDNMKTVVDRWEHGEPILNLKMLDFAAFYGFGIHLAPPRRGDYKGKVERPFWFLETNFFDGRTLHSIQEANDELGCWLSHRCNSRDHGTLQRRPVDMFEEERSALKPLPKARYDDRDLAYRLVDPYGRIHYDGNSYSVGSRVGKWVYVRASEKEVQIYDFQAHLLATHERIPSGERQTSQLPEHMPKKGRIRVDELLARFSSWGDSALAFAKELRARGGYPGVQLAKILALQQQYAIEDILSAIEHATSYRAYDAKAVQRILESRATPRTLKDILAERSSEAIQRVLGAADVRQRSLDDYARLLSPHLVKEPNHGEEEPSS